MESISQFKNLSSWREDSLTIKAGECKEVDFHDTAPNMFICQNANDVVLYISISKIPTVKNYEFLVGKNETKTFGRPTSTRKIYVLNAGSIDATIKIFSIFDRFDLNVLKDISMSLEGAEIITDGIIRGFESGISLPSGTNIIGKVGLDTDEKALINHIKLNVADIQGKTANIDTNIAGIVTVDEYIYNLLNSILKNDGVNLVWLISNYMKTLVKQFTPNFECTPVYMNGETSFEYREERSGSYRIKFCWLFNDSPKDFTIMRDTTAILTVKSGEQLSDFEIEIASGESITFENTDNDFDFRCKYYVY